MNFKKFCFVLCLITSLFLFLSGFAVLNYINNSSQSGDADSPDGNNLLDSVIDNFKGSKTPFNLLLLGGDKVNKNTDTMMLVNFDPSTAKVSIMSIPRDTKVKIEGSYQKINYAFPHGGEKLAAETVSKLLGVNIKYFVFVDTSAFRKIIDLLGGVDIYVPVDMDYDDPYQNLHIHLKKGNQHLDGKKAEQFMRFRKPNGKYSKELEKYYDGSDIKRIDAQQNFIKEVIKQKANILYLPKLNDIIDVVYKNIETNITLPEISRLIKTIPNFNVDNVKMFTLPGNTIDGSPWYYICDESEADKIVQEYFKGKGTFVDGSNADSIKKTDEPQKTTSKSNSSSTKNTTGSSKPKSNTDYTKNNPSNGESTIKGSTKPAP